MNINVADNFFSPEEKNKLMITLNVTDEDFDSAIEKIALSSLSEYKQMLLGNGMPTRADEIRQYRLLYLIKNYFQSRIPTEAEVSIMFQLTETESRSLIRNVRTRFRYRLEDEINNTLRQTVDSMTEDGGEYQCVILSDDVCDQLNRIIDNNAPYLDPISKCRGSARKYKAKPDTHSFLSRFFQLEVAATNE